MNESNNAVTMGRPAPIVTIIEPTIQRMEQELESTSNKLRVAAYARVSTEQDEQESSYEAQVDYYTGYIESRPDWELVGVFADKGITGTNTKNRQQFKKMIEMALNGQIDLILTKSISRFARNTVDTLQTVRKLKAEGVEVIFEKENIHTLDPKCEVMLTIMSSLAQEESRSMSENIRWGKQKSMRDGKVAMSYSHFLGYRKGPDGRPEIVEDEAKIVRGIYELFLNGTAIAQIARILTANNIPTPGGKTNWRISTVRSILSNEKYKGEAILQKTYTVDYLTKQVRKNKGEKPSYVVHLSHEPIIDPDTFDRVQRELERRSNARPRKAGDKSPFANRLVCGTCGTFYGHKVWKSRGKAAARHDVWCCNHRYTNEDKCTTPILREDEIKAAFRKVLKKLKCPEHEYTDDLWYKLVEVVTIRENRKAEFHLTDKSIVTVHI